MVISIGNKQYTHEFLIQYANDNISNLQEFSLIDKHYKDNKGGYYLLGSNNGYCTFYIKDTNRIVQSDGNIFAPYRRS